MMSLPEVTVEAHMVEGWVHWKGQAAQHPKIGKPGIHHETHKVIVGRATNNRTGQVVAYIKAEVEILMYRNSKGVLIGVLYYYIKAIPELNLVPGLCDVWVAPNRLRRGIGTALISEADKRWTIRFGIQRYSESGRALCEAYIANRDAVKL